MSHYAVPCHIFPDVRTLLSDLPNLSCRCPVSVHVCICVHVCVCVREKKWVCVGVCVVMVCFYCVWENVQVCVCACVCVCVCVHVSECKRKGGGVARERFCSRCLFAAGVPTTPRVMAPATREPSPAIICCWTGKWKQNVHSDWCDKAMPSHYAPWAHSLLGVYASWLPHALHACHLPSSAKPGRICPRTRNSRWWLLISHFAGRDCKLVAVVWRVLAGGVGLFLGHWYLKCFGHRPIMTPPPLRSSQTPHYLTCFGRGGGVVFPRGLGGKWAIGLCQKRGSAIQAKKWICVCIQASDKQKQTWGCDSVRTW